jgi:hypothetical protein
MDVGLAGPLDQVLRLVQRRRLQAQRQQQEGVGGGALPE